MAYWRLGLPAGSAPIGGIFAYFGGNARQDTEFDLDETGLACSGCLAQNGTMRPCFIHCGPHKTGSTSIQHGLYMHRALHDQIGIHIPNLTGQEKATESHFRLVADLPLLIKSGPDAAPAWAELAKQLKLTPHIPILSCEILSVHLYKAAPLQAVVEFFKSLGFRPHFLYFLRDEPTWLNSLYVQQTKRFYTADRFSAFLDEAAQAPRYNYRRLLLRLIERDDVDTTVLPFESSAKAGLLGAVLDVVGGDLSQIGALPEPPRQNPNAGAKAVYVGRLITAEFEARGINPRAHRGIFRVFKKGYNKHGWASEAYCGFDDEQADQLRARNQKSNDFIASRFWGRPWEDMIPRPVKMVRREFDLDNHWIWEHRDVRKLLHGLKKMVAQIDR